MIMQKLRNKEGFTLIELMIVIAIIGILAAIAIPNFISYRKRGYDGAADSDAHNALTAMTSYFSDFEKITLSSFSLANMQSQTGFRQSTGVTVGLSFQNYESFYITAKHDRGDTTFTYFANNQRTKG